MSRPDLDPALPDFTPQEGLEAAWWGFVDNAGMTLRFAGLVLKYAALTALWQTILFLCYAPPRRSSSASRKTGKTPR